MEKLIDIIKNPKGHYMNSDGVRLQWNQQDLIDAEDNDSYLKHVERNFYRVTSRLGNVEHFGIDCERLFEEFGEDSEWYSVPDETVDPTQLCWNDLETRSNEDISEWHWVRHLCFLVADFVATKYKEYPAMWNGVNLRAFTKLRELVEEGAEGYLDKEGTTYKLVINFIDIAIERGECSMQYGWLLDQMKKVWNGDVRIDHMTDGTYTIVYVQR